MYQERSQALPLGITSATATTAFVTEACRSSFDGLTGLVAGSDGASVLFKAKKDAVQEPAIATIAFN